MTKLNPDLIMRTIYITNNRILQFTVRRAVNESLYNETLDYSTSFPLKLAILSALFEINFMILSIFSKF